MENTDSEIRNLLHTATTGSLGERREAMTRLEEVIDPTAAYAATDLEGLLDYFDDFVANAAVRCLARLRDRTFTSRFVRMLEEAYHRYQSNRYEAGNSISLVVSLGDLGDPAAIPLLQRLYDAERGTDSPLCPKLAISLKTLRGKAT